MPKTNAPADTNALSHNRGMLGEKHRGRTKIAPATITILRVTKCCIQPLRWLLPIADAKSEIMSPNTLSVLKKKEREINFAMR